MLSLQQLTTLLIHNIKCQHEKRRKRSVCLIKTHVNTLAFYKNTDKIYFKFNSLEGRDPTHTHTEN